MGAGEMEGTEEGVMGWWLAMEQEVTVGAVEEWVTVVVGPVKMEARTGAVREKAARVAM